MIVCVLSDLIDLTISPWWREKVIVYYYYHNFIGLFFTVRRCNAVIEGIKKIIDNRSEIMESKYLCD